MTTRTTFGALATLVLAGSVTLLAQTTPPTQTQTPTPTTSEAQLLQRTAQSPGDVSAFLDLARLYVEQHRFEEAQRILQRAIVAVQTQALITSGAQPPATAAATGSNEPVLRVGGSIAEPKRIKYVDPIYPAEALAAKLQGYVILEATIGPDGSVRDTKVLRSTPLLDQAATDAVRQWKYQPPLLNGAPVQVAMAVTVIFSLK